MQVIDWDDHDSPMLESSPLPAHAGLMRELVLDTELFRVERWCASSPQTLTSDGDSFRILFCEGGQATVSGSGEDVFFEPGTTVLLPANLETTDLAPGPEGVRLISVAL